jgi:hypothetical protein
MTFWWIYDWRLTIFDFGGGQAVRAPESRVKVRIIAKEERGHAHVLEVCEGVAVGEGVHGVRIYDLRFTIYDLRFVRNGGYRSETAGEAAAWGQGGQTVRAPIQIGSGVS